MEQSVYERSKLLIDSGRVKVNTESGTIETKRLQGKDKGQYQKPYLSCSPYLKAYLSVDGVTFSVFVHQLVMIAAGFNLVGKAVNHINGNKHDNRLSNLEVISHSDNTKHFYKMYYNKLLGT
jgi:hypothetical protein